MFSDARNVHISGGQFIHSTVTHFHATQQTAWDRLRHYCALSALLDSKERFDPPKCAEETREALIDEVLEWINSGDESAMIAWLHGGAGAGKSALAQTIAEILRKRGRLAASFFFSRTSTAERGDGDRLIPTLVFQIVEAFPELRPYVEECIEKNSGLFDKSRRSQMETLFIGPLVQLRDQASFIQTSRTSPLSTTPLTPLAPSNLSPKKESRRRRFLKRMLLGRVTTGLESRGDVLSVIQTPRLPNVLSGPLLIVIDGLDECNNEETQKDLLRILADAVPLLPVRFRFLIASRPEGYILRVFDHDACFQRLSVHQIDLEEINADDDIRRFLTRGFQEIRRTHPLRAYLDPSWPSPNIIEIIVEKSSSHFIYASTIMKYIQHSRARPDTRLEVILGLSAPPSKDQPFVELDSLYSHIFMSIEEHGRSRINCFFGILFLAGQKRFDYLKTSIVGLEEYLEMRAGDIILLLEPVLSLVALPDNGTSEIKVLHASLFDYLQDHTRSGTLCLDLDMAHEALAKHSFKKVSVKPIDADVTWGLIFLTHCLFSRPFDGLMEFLYSFPLLYDVILQPTFLSKPPHKCFESFFLVHYFLVLVSEKSHKDSSHGHTLQAKRLEQHLRSIQGLDPNHSLSHDSPLFSDISAQSKYQVYETLAQAILSLADTRWSDLLRYIYWESPQGFSREVIQNLRAHVLMICLPHLTSKHVDLCERYAKAVSYGNLNEFDQVLYRRVKEYLGRVDKDADPDMLEECKKSWRIVDDIGLDGST